jgi:hypothetical protein
MVGTEAKPSTSTPSVGVPPMRVQAMTDDVLDEDFDELEEETLELTEDFELLDELGVALLDEELALELLLDETLDDEVPEGAEHSLVPPATLVPAPKVASLQTKLPDRTL